MSATIRVGTGFDAHRLVAGRPLWLGGCRIEHDQGLEGHSDGDALLHALTDAVLGGVAAPDIGSLFPPGDPRYAGADSAQFLAEALRLAAEKGYRVRSVDVVVIAESPRLAPHIAPIRARLAELLAVGEDAVGLKATTTDGMGFTGRGEGVAVQAIAVLEAFAPESG